MQTTSFENQKNKFQIFNTSSNNQLTENNIAINNQQQQTQPHSIQAIKINNENSEGHCSININSNNQFQIIQLNQNDFNRFNSNNYQSKATSHQQIQIQPQPSINTNNNYQSRQLINQKQQLMIIQTDPANK
jgi:hypothetical protein